MEAPKLYKLNDIDFADFLANKPLYSKVIASSGIINSFTKFEDFENKPFKFLCPKEQEVQTFRTDLGEMKYSIKQKALNEMFGNSEKIKNSSLNDTDKTINYILYLVGFCQSCGERVTFLLRAFSDKGGEDKAPGTIVYLEKVGQSPSPLPMLSKTLEKYLSEEDRTNYKRALVCKSNGYGIGAYAYLRRVIENEIKKIVKDISELEFEGVDEVKRAYSTYQQDHQMNKLIDVLDGHLPTTLKGLGNNPIKLLYEQLSGGIHSFSDELCLSKAESIDVLINFVVEKINEGKNQLKSVQAAIKSLQG